MKKVNYYIIILYLIFSFNFNFCPFFGLKFVAVQDLCQNCNPHNYYTERERLTIPAWELA